jgi:hypothetical protein
MCAFVCVISFSFWYLWEIWCSVSIRPMHNYHCGARDLFKKFLAFGSCVRLEIFFYLDFFFFMRYGQGRTGHITRWEKSHGAPLEWGPLRQSGAPRHHDLFFNDLFLKKNPTKIWGANPPLDMVRYFYPGWLKST